jgi:hypothetical protein
MQEGIGAECQLLTSGGKSILRVLESGYSHSAVKDAADDDISEQRGLAGPGRAIDPMMPASFPSSARAAFTAACWSRTSGWPPEDGQRA